MSFGWPEILLLVVVGPPVAIMVLAASTVFLTSYFLVKPVFANYPLEANEPETADPATTSSDFNPYREPQGLAGSYAEVRHRRLLDLGFTPHGRYGLGQPRTTQAKFSLWLSPDNQILAVVNWATIAGVKPDMTILYTGTDQGRYLVSSDQLTTINAPSILDNEVFRRLELDRLIAGHRERIETLAGTVQPFTQANGLEAYRTLNARLADSLVKHGEARYLDPDQTRFRCTFKGACLATLRAFNPPKGYRGRTARRDRG